MSRFIGCGGHRRGRHKDKYNTNSRSRQPQTITSDRQSDRPLYCRPSLKNNKHSTAFLLLHHTFHPLALSTLLLLIILLLSITLYSLSLALSTLRPCFYSLSHVLTFSYFSSYFSPSLYLFSHFPSITFPQILIPPPLITFPPSFSLLLLSCTSFSRFLFSFTISLSFYLAFYSLPSFYSILHLFSPTFPLSA